MEDVLVLGGAQTDFERNWSKEGKSAIALLKETIDDSLKNVGISYGDIAELNERNRIACFVGNFLAEYYVNQGHVGALLTEVNPAFSGVPSARFEAACASSAVALDAAITKIRVCDYDVAIVIGWEMMKTVDSKICGDFLGRAALYEREAMGIDFPFPKLFGRLTDELIIKYNLDESRLMENLASISNINYANAKKNSKAQTRKWFMSDKQANQRGTATNPFVGGKLAVSDCSQVTDGAAMVVLSSQRFASEFNVRKEFPVVKGWGHRVAPIVFADKMKESKEIQYILPWTRQTVLDAYNRSGLTVNDIDFFETHDCFTSSEYMAISAFGLTEPGKEYEAIEDGRIAFCGSKPVNPSGGLIGCGHPVGATGIRMFLDLYKQISGNAESYQVKKADNGMMLNIGGTATTNYTFIIGKQ
jgi:acetyl-CoA C-acetyltransferase